ncbi:BTAD domain-containing putative transcriptional regulator [Micromonospora sp. NPDC047793]|uniref:ATP-binding protein n=1 Tax=unclassified Micromonospora TaxID=2617518 RepID=UPI0033CA51B9
MPGSNAYRLDVAPTQVDYHRFRRLVTHARHAANLDQHDRCTALLATALQLWRTNPLAELRGARSEHLRRDMREQLLGAEKLLAGSELATGHHDRALTRLEPLIADNPYDETLARLQATALHSVGRIHDAREYVAAFRRRYRRRMRIDPHLNFLDIPPNASPPPAPRASADQTASAPQQLPYDVPDFTGHTELLSELDALATDSGTPNVIALTGMPGVGKTAFATRWGHHRRDWFPDGQLYLNAEAHSQVSPVHPDDAMRRFLAGLGVPTERIPTDPVHRSTLYHRLLGDRRTLVVLDNVLDSDQAQHLIPRSSTSLMIVISRNRLSGLSVRHGVRSLTIPPLPHADRHSLLTRIIGSHRADAEPAAAHRLAQLSGGLPIALRIIGEHVASQPGTPLGDLAEELGDRLLDIDGDDSRELTVGTVFAWSVNALAPLPARLFRRLGLFPGTTVAVEAASVLLAADPNATGRALDRLARAHLIHHDAVGRYRMHDLLHRYATDRERVEGLPEERHAALHRLLDWYLLTAVAAVRWLEPHRPVVPDLPEATMVRPLELQSEADALRWCEAERTNLPSVIRAANREGFPRHAWQIVDTLHEVYDRSGPQDDLRDMLNLALDAATADAHLPGCAGTLANLGAVYFASHDYQHAAVLFTRARNLAAENGLAEIELACLHNLASVHLRTGHLTTAIDVFHQVLAACRTADNPAGAASTLSRLADAHRQLNAPDQARRYYHEALTICEQVGSLRGQSLNHVRLAELDAQAGQPDDALSHAQVALELHHRVNDDVIRCDALVAAAEARLHLGQHRHCLSEATLARAVSEGLADPLREARALVVLAEALVATGEHRIAHAHCQEALDLLNNAGEQMHLAVQNRLLAIVAATAC